MLRGFGRSRTRFPGGRPECPYKPAPVAYNRANKARATPGILVRAMPPGNREATMFRTHGQVSSRERCSSRASRALGLGQAVLQHKAEAQGASVQAPRFRRRSAVAEAASPNNWLLGWTIGVWVDETGTMSGSSIAARADCTTTNAAPSSIRRSPNAAARRRRSWSSIRPADLVRSWGGPGAGL